MKQISETQKFIYGAIGVAFTLVLTQTWVGVLTKLSKVVTNNIRCDRKKLKEEKYKKCIEDDTLLSQFVSAIITTIILIILGIIFVKVSGYNIKSGASTLVKS
jgi:ABC-type glycerol-3-phosphate transport system permease component